jgi:hypothetical protein
MVQLPDDETLSIRELYHDMLETKDERQLCLHLDYMVTIAVAFAA